MKSKGKAKKKSGGKKPAKLVKFKGAEIMDLWQHVHDPDAFKADWLGGR